MVWNWLLSPWAFWMSTSTPAASNAAFEELGVVRAPALGARGVRQDHADLAGRRAAAAAAGAACRCRRRKRPCCRWPAGPPRQGRTFPYAFLVSFRINPGLRRIPVCAAGTAAPWTRGSGVVCCVGQRIPVARCSTSGAPAFLCRYNNPATCRRQPSATTGPSKIAGLPHNVTLGHFADRTCRISGERSAGRNGVVSAGPWVLMSESAYHRSAESDRPAPVTPAARGARPRRTSSPAPAPSRRSTVGSRLRWPSGLMPPRTYPLLRSAAARSASAARLPPAACGQRLEIQIPGHRYDRHGQRAVHLGDQSLEERRRHAERRGNQRAVVRGIRRDFVRMQFVRHLLRDEHRCRRGPGRLLRHGRASLSAEHVRRARHPGQHQRGPRATAQAAGPCATAPAPAPNRACGSPAGRCRARAAGSAAASGRTAARR